MADTKTQYTVIDGDDLHEEHLCYIVSQGLHLSDRPAYEELVAEPRFRCSHCGRTARSRRNLCVPVDL
jgi:hypothetical protein